MTLTESERKELPFNDAATHPSQRDPGPRLDLVIDLANHGRCLQPPAMEGEANNRPAAYLALMIWLTQRGWRINDPSVYAGDGLSHPNHERWMDSASQYHLLGQIINAVDRELYNIINGIETRPTDSRFTD